MNEIITWMYSMYRKAMIKQGDVAYLEISSDII